MLLLSVGHNEVTSVHQPRRLGEREGRVHGQQLQAPGTARRSTHPARLKRFGKRDQINQVGLIRLGWSAYLGWMELLNCGQRT